MGQFTSLNKTDHSLNIFGGITYIVYLCIINNNYTNMKKFFMIFMVLTSALTMQAGDFTYLTFETTDGEKASVPVESLTLTISGNTLMAGTQSFTISNLSKMYFSTTDETSGIEEITNTTLDEASDIYDLQGHKVSKEQMKKGLYIIKTHNRTYKMIVK